MTTKRLMIAAILVIVLVSIFSYISALKLNFLYHDDYVIIKETYMNPCDYYLGNWVGGRGGGGLYRPFIISTINLDRHIWGLSPFGYHLSNIAFHAANGALMFILAYLLLGQMAVAFCSAILFSVMPVNAEAVNWVCCRCDLLATMFFLSAVIFFHLYIKGKKMTSYILFLAAFIVSLLSKEIAIMLPFVIFAYLFFYENSGIKQKLMRLVPLFAILAVYFIIRYISLGTFIGGYKIGFVGGLINSVLGGIRTIQLTFLPFTQENLFMYFILLPLLAAGTLYAFVVFYRANGVDPFMTFSLIFTIAGLLPVLYILPIGFNFQCSRFWYLPSIGISWMISYYLLGKHALKERMKKIGLVIFIAFVIYNLYFLVIINRDWQKASDLTREIKRQAVAIAARYPKGSSIYFWETPDNYQGCYVGFPCLKPPFIDTGRNIRGYIDNDMWYMSYMDVSKNRDIKGAAHYVYNEKKGRYVKCDLQDVLRNDYQRLNDPRRSQMIFKRFLMTIGTGDSMARRLIRVLNARKRTGK